jgi:hypothetical protein
VEGALPSLGTCRAQRVRPVVAGGDRLDRLSGLAETLAASWAARARSTTTAGQERAVLRLFGVHGLDRDGRPLAGAVVDRWRGGDPGLRTGGIALPFAIALLEYDLAPQQLALDIASGAVDLALEAQLLRERDRRSVAEAEADRLTDLALQRIDANRIARREVVDLLGDAASPRVGTTLMATEIAAAVGEATRLVADGMDVLRIEVPVGRELADHLQDAGLDVPEWRSGERSAAPAGDEPAPTGSQRGLARMRQALDEAAAERGAYVRLEIVAPAFGAPEGSVVAAFERIDLLRIDALDEVVGRNVDPDRALSDHAFAHRLQRRAGTGAHIGPGPLVVAPDLERGMPAAPATRAGRALALQAVSVAFARQHGLATDAILVGALPPWTAAEASPGHLALAEVDLRRRLFPDHALTFDEPAADAVPSSIWPALVAGTLPFAGAVAVITHLPGPAPAGVVRGVRAAATIAADLATGLGYRSLTGPAEEHADGMTDAAIRTLERLRDDGWRSILGDPPPGSGSGRFGTGSVLDRTDPYHPLERMLSPR